MAGRGPNESHAPPRPRRGRTVKKSCGVILIDYSAASTPRVVLVQRRYTYAFGDFVHGRYDTSRPESALRLLRDMTVDERLLIWGWDFQAIWARVWLRASVNPDLYARKRQIFYSAWGSEKRLQSLIQVSSLAPAVEGPEWEIPKGRAHGGESDLECAIREFGEETGIPKKSYQILPTFRLEMPYTIGSIEYQNVYFLGVALCPIAVRVTFTRTLAQPSEVAVAGWYGLDEIRRRDHPSRRLEVAVRAALNFARKTRRGRRIGPAFERASRPRHVEVRDPEAADSFVEDSEVVTAFD